MPPQLQWACAAKVQPPSTEVRFPSTLQTRGHHLCDPSHSRMGGTHLCHLNPLAETSRGSSPTRPSVWKCYPRALQGLHRRLLRRGLCPPPPLQSVGPHHTLRKVNMCKYPPIGSIIILPDDVYKSSKIMLPKEGLCLKSSLKSSYREYNSL